MNISIKNKILALPLVYDFFTWAVGGNRYRQTLLREYIRPTPSCSILDIGCGTAEILKILSNVKYTGMDYNPAYIHSARRRFGYRATFTCERISLVGTKQSSQFDIAIALGVLHHLADGEAESLFEIAENCLKPGGRLITCDPVFVQGQSRIARHLIRMDRGLYPRNTEQYLALTKRFQNIQHHVRNDLIHIPYTHIILECIKNE